MVQDMIIWFEASIFVKIYVYASGVIDDPLTGSVMVCFINVVATYAALKLMDSTARRTLLLWSAGGMFFSTVLIMLALLGYERNWVALVAVMAYVSFFEIGLGPIPWLIVAEMFDAKHVATASKICFSMVLEVFLILDFTL